MTIEKIIELMREDAKKLREDIEFCVQKSTSGCDECIHCDIPCMEKAEVNEQIAEWLEDYKREQSLKNEINKVFEKILENIENLKLPFPDECPSYYKNTNELLDMTKQIVQEAAKDYSSGWIPVKTRPMTEEEKENYSEYLIEGDGFIYECPLPDDGQEVLITSKYGSVDKTTFYTDCGNYFENYEDYDEVIAWQPLPEPFKESK